MYRILLVDDEPLILSGIVSLLNWEEHGCTIAGKATNGSQAFKMISEILPDIVISDIRMPSMDGLELMEACREEGCKAVFILLTNLEEFQIARQALALGAIDYLVKLDLEPPQLAAALERAKNACDQQESHQSRMFYDSLIRAKAGQIEESYFQLQLSSPAANVPVPEGIRERYMSPFVIYICLYPEHVRFDAGGPYDFASIKQQMSDIVSEICSRYFQAFSVVFSAENTLFLVASLKSQENSRQTLSQFCNKVNGALNIYFGLKAAFGICDAVTGLSSLQTAAEHARLALQTYYNNPNTSICFYEGQPATAVPQHGFNINFLKRPLSNAVLQNNSALLSSVFSELGDLFCEYCPGHSQAVSACINLYTYLSSLFQNESNSYSHIFPATLNIAEHVKQLGSLPDLLVWLDSLKSQICLLLDERRDKTVSKLVFLARQYIQQHCREKLTLSDIAEYLNISPSHLSNTFRKSCNMTLSDYIAQVKIDEAKTLIDTHQYLIYEVADMLGFENPYYFSKVFRKVAGMSPREYEQHSQTI